MNKILGLDLGTNSIGWALINYDPAAERGSILGTGVRIFSEGVDNLGQGEKEMSKNASRRVARGARKQIFRRKLRKRILKRALRSYGMMPEVPYEIEEWYHMNPYNLRERAIREEVSLMELGRIFYHMGQRRGFKSNSRSASKNTDGAIFKGTADQVGIAETREKMEDHATFGDYLAKLYPKEGESYQFTNKRIRGRYTTRQMYIAEFEMIWDVQSKYHSSLTEEKKLNIGGRKEDGYEKDGILFFQRPLKSQKHLRGKCSFEPEKTKAQLSCIPFEYYRIHQWINGVRCNDEPLPKDLREKALQFLLKKAKVSFIQLRKHLKLNGPEFKFNYLDSDKIKGSDTIRELSHKKLFGDKWFDLSDAQQEEIWHALYFYDDKPKLKKWVQKHYDLSDKKAQIFSELMLTDGFAKLSRKAINNILPFLRKGYEYDIAVALAGIKKAIESRGEPITDKELLFIEDNVPVIIRSKIQGGYIEEVKQVLRDEFNLTDEQLSNLYHHSTELEKQEVIGRLPIGKEADQEIQAIRNPVVVRAIFEVRKVVNQIIEKFGAIDQIKVELARDLKTSKEARNQIRKRQKENEERNEKAIQGLKENKQPITHENILKYKLWQECNHEDPYTGKTIAISDLFNDNKIQIEHIIPYSRSLDDSYMNKTLCDAKLNQNKGDRTPWEYFSGMGEEEWEKVKNRALSIFQTSPEFPNRYRKFKKFIAKELDDDFISRQLNDTRYISKEAKNYLQKVCKDVQVAPGQMTSKLRHHWGMNELIREEDKEKNREDHRHHAIDALVMACHQRKHLQKISKFNRYRRPPNWEFPEPWENFWVEARNSIREILVSHDNKDRVIAKKATRVKKNGKVFKSAGVAARGALHKATVYGKRKPPKSLEGYHKRNSLEKVKNQGHVKKIVDDRIRSIIYNHLRSERINIDAKKFSIPSGTFFKKNEDGVLEPRVFLPNKRGDKVPIKKVRMVENFNNAEQLKDKINGFADLQNNHHVLIYNDVEGKLKENVVSFWEVVERKIQRQPKYQLPATGEEIVTILKADDMFILGSNEAQLKGWLDRGEKLKIFDALYRVQKFSSGYYVFRHHAASTLDHDDQMERVQSFSAYEKLNPIKVRINKIGDIEVI